MEYIDLSKYVRTGEGANGASYDSVEDPLVMVKLYNENYPEHTIYTELDAAKKVFSLGIPSPEPGELVTDGKRIGIRFRRIAGKRSFARAFADEPDRVEEYAREFAKACRELHKVKCPEGYFPDAKRQFLTLLEADTCFNDAQKQVIADRITSAPDAGNVLHGDMHFGNVITTLPAGMPLSSPHDVFFIDLGYFSHGCYLFDLGMMRNICITADEDFRFESFHVHKDVTEKVWEYFVDEYFEGRLSPDEADELVMPYQAIKLLLVEYNVGFMFPHYKKFVCDTLGI